MSIRWSNLLYLCRCFVPAVLVLALAALPAAAGTPGSDFASAERDWLLPSEVAAGAGARSVSAPSIVGTACPGCSTGKVVYTAFNGDELTLNEYRGKHVRVLLSNRWVSRMSEEQIVGLVESSDRTYGLLRDLLGKEPFLDNDLLTLAFVPDTCGLGCGVIGHGKSELWDGTSDDGFDADWLEEIAVISEQGISNIVISHEMTHNFDVFASHLWYHTDSSHWWTDLVNFYSYSWGILQTTVPVGSSVLTDHLWFEQLGSWQDILMGSYLAKPAHDWARCVRDESCDEIRPKRPRAALSWRILRQGGASVLPETLRFLGEKTAGKASPATPEDIEELWLEALAAGAGGDLTGCLDDMKWHSSVQLTDRMLAQGGLSAICQDSDGDGFTPFAGDCDDGDAQVGPHGTDVAGNGVDDDCSGLADEPLVTLSSDRGSLPPPPWRLQGQASGRSHYEFRPTRAGRAVLRGCSPAGGFDGHLGLILPSGSVGRFQALRPGSCVQEVLALTKEEWGLALFVEPGGQGPVSFTLQYADDWPAPWGTLRVSQLDQRRLVVSATVTDDSAWRAPGDEIRFELSGFGRIGTATLVNGKARLEWTAPVDLEAGALLYAYAQPVTGGIPAGEGLRQVFRPIDVRPCVAGPDTACLLGGRFEVTGTMNDFSRPPKTFDLRVMDFPGGRAESEQAAFFDSFQPGNFEIGVKMVNGCTLPEDHPNHAFWLFVGGLTSADSQVRVEDAATGDLYEWTNPPGTLPTTLADTHAFACSDDAVPPGACTSGSHRACLLDRFQVTGTMKDFASPPSQHELRVMDFPGGRAESEQAAFFESFQEGNFEIGVKMVDGCTLPANHPNRAYWLFVGGLTSATTRVEVRQISTGEMVTWTNPRGNLPQSSADTAAFPCE